MMALPFLSFLPLITTIIIITTTTTTTAAAAALPPTEGPLMQDYPFVSIWNAPTDVCQLLQIPLDTAGFQAVTTPAPVPGQFLTLFYEDRLGLYPKVGSHHLLFSGGVPQSGNLTKHLAKARRQIDNAISQDSGPGLAVIDWESWRPLWDQNWGSKRVYKKLSIARALETSPFLSDRTVAKLAKKQFQQAGRHFMEKTIDLGVCERPSRLWGFYLFPDCFNYDWNKSTYTGKCSATTQEQNNQMLWLWQHSTALFPSIYLHQSLKNSPRAALYVRYRIQEALRVAALPNRAYTVPIYVYSRILYRDQTQKFQTETDLVNTVGESAALGAAGVIMWGGTRDYNNKASCQALSEYLTSTFNPYMANVTAAARLCSQVLCQSKGRCVRKDFNSGHFLHLNANFFKILRADRKYVAIGVPPAADLKAWADGFTCQCYTGNSCSAQLTPLTTIWVSSV